MPNKYRQLINFLIAGSLSAIVYYVSLFIMLKFEVSNNTSITFGFITSSIFNFFYNRNITFSSKKSKLNLQIIKYLLMLGFSYLLNISIINLLIISYNANIYIASALTIGMITCLRFLISKHFVYRISH